MPNHLQLSLQGQIKAELLVYKESFNPTWKFYIENTQPHDQKRIQGPYSDVRRLLTTGKKSDFFASHLAMFFDKKIQNVRTFNQGPFFCIRSGCASRKYCISSSASSSTPRSGGSKVAWSFSFIASGWNFEYDHVAVATVNCSYTVAILYLQQPTVKCK